MILWMRQFLCTLIILLLSICFSNAQSDSTSAEEEDDSVVYIYETPLIIKQTVEQKEEIYQKWFFELGGSGFKFTNDHLLCNQFTSYKNTIEQCTKPIGGYTIGGTLIYNPKNISYSLGASYSSYLERFSKTSDSIVKGINQYNYIDLSGNLGIWIFRKQKYVSLLVNGGVMLSRLVSSKGYTIDYVDLTKVITDKSAGRDALWVGSTKFGLKMIFLNNKPIKIFIEPYTRVNFTSVLSYKDNYYLRRWAYGVQAGVIYTF
jgi:hypothetical protein